MSLVNRVVRTVWSGWIFDNYKSVLGLVSIVLTKTGILPGVELGDGISLDEALLIWGVLDNKVKDYGLRKVAKNKQRE